MTIRELIELNQMITDVCIDVRDNGLLLDHISIGEDVGITPPYPMRVPIKPEYARELTRTEKHFRDAKYIRKSINAKDDGKEYWQVKVNRIPGAWLDLTVTSWTVWSSGTVGTNRSRYNWGGEQINIIAEPSGKSLEIKEPVEKQDDNLAGQISLEEWWNEEQKD